MVLLPIFASAFPGWLKHGVEVNQSDRERVSISFNVLAIPQAGN